MAKTPTFVIVGGGLAAAKAAEGLRDYGYDGRIVLIGAEQHLPYERPPLSKGYLVGSDELAGAFVHTADWYDDHQVELLLGTPVTAVDLASHTVLRDDRRVHFDKLLIATGASPRRLPAADASGARWRTYGPSRTASGSRPSCDPVTASRSSAADGSVWRWRPRHALPGATWS
jgi:3-phenylpropionate/trans-cinnamate dioxygenase ferredoxin reductase subunit